jgi:hypothetical protein
MDNAGASQIVIDICNVFGTKRNMEFLFSLCSRLWLWNLRGGVEITDVIHCGSNFETDDPYAL